MTAVHGNFAPSELVLLRAADATALQQTVAALEHFLEQAPSAPLKDVAYTCSRTEGPMAVAVVTQSTEDLRARLAFPLRISLRGLACRRGCGGHGQLRRYAHRCGRVSGCVCRWYHHLSR